MIVCQCIEMDEDAGAISLLLVIAPQKGRFAHLDAINEAGLPQDRSTTGPPRRRGSVLALAIGALVPKHHWDEYHSHR